MNPSTGYSTKNKNDLSAKTREELEEELNRLTAHNRLLEEMTADIPVGICKIILDEGYTLIEGNESFYNLYGYTPGQMEAELSNQLARTIHSDDLLQVRQKLKGARDCGSAGFDAEHRIVRRDGTVIWGMVNGRFSKSDGGTTANCAVIDMTNRKEIEEELRINEELFRMAMAQTDNTIFSYDIPSRVMLHATKSAKIYGLSNKMDNVPDSLVENGVIHPDTIDIFLETYAKIRNGAPKASCMIKAHQISGDFVWRRITLTNIYDSEGHAVRAVGMLEDIDEQMKRENQLRLQSERDSLTGLLNKGATQEHIAELLSKAVKNQVAGLFIVDIDSFKKINDGYGHPFGDRVLAETARRISSIFNSEDIVGRIGGDEFMVYIHDLADMQQVKDKGKEMCKAFQRKFIIRGIITSVSCSIGAAVYPAAGTSFEELYQKADIALYDAKQRGKRQFRLYNPDMKAEYRGNRTEIDNRV